jgi:hypothetical protein
VFNLDRTLRVSTRRPSIAVAATATLITAIGLLGAPSAGVTTVRAADCSVHSDKRLYCGNNANAKLYWNPTYGSTVSGVMRTTYSWFTCWQHGQVHPGHNDIWYWTKGDVPQNGYSGWGFMPAFDVRTTVDPAPGLERCIFS